MSEMEHLQAKKVPPRRTSISPSLERLAVNVYAQRTFHQLSFAKLAELSGVSLSTLKYIERRRADPSIATLLRLANAFALTLGELVGDMTLPGAGVSASVLAVRRYRNPDAIAAMIGRRVWTYRTRRGFSQRAFVEHAGISKGMLHYIETNTIEPGTKMVERLATAFEMSFAEFVEAAESPVLALVRAEPEGGSDDRREMSTVRALVFDETAAQRMYLRECQVRGRQRISETTAPLGTTAMMYVLEGNVRLTFETEHHLIGRGDAIYFAADRPFSAAGSSIAPARFLLLVNAPAERRTAARGRTDEA